jgi:outer membrane biosynthesis protein TonB
MSARTACRKLRVAALVAALALPLAGCETFDLTNLIPDSKKKLPGDRREVFPEGVPGVSKGVPPELLKGYQAQPDGANATAAAPPPEVKPEPKPAAKPKPKPKQAKPTPTVAPEYQQQGQAPQQGQQGQWPQQQRQPQQSAWPASPQPGTFSR